MFLRFIHAFGFTAAFPLGNAAEASVLEGLKIPHSFQ